MGERILEKPNSLEYLFYLLIALTIFTSLSLVSLYNFLLFHTLVEAISIIIYVAIFMFYANSRRYLKNNYFSILGTTFIFIAFIDLLHTLAYPGMNLFQGFTSNHSISLWLAARLVYASCLFVAPLFIDRKIRVWLLNVGLVVVTTISVLIIFFYPSFLPPFYISEVGLTGYKVALEYAIITVLLASYILLRQKREKFDFKVYRLLSISIFATILSEWFLTLYFGFQDAFSIIGHLFKICSSYMMYLAIIRIGLSQPYDLMFKELKEKEVQLSLSEERFRSVVENIFETIFETDLNGHIIYASPTTENRLKYNTGELVGREFVDLFKESEKPKVRSLLSFVLSDKRQGSLETELMKKDGETISVEVDIIPLVRGYEVIRACIAVKDISERKALEKRVMESERLAAVGQSSMMIGHDLRNPLQTLYNVVYSMSHEINTLNIPDDKKENLFKHLETLKERVKYMDKIVSDLQAYSRPIILNLEGTNLQQLLDKVIREIEVPENVGLSIEVEKDLPRIFLDQLVIERALYNIVLNALQAMPKGGLLTIKAYHKEDKVYISVKDTGIGMPKEVLEKLFTPFFTTKAQGQGLGLSVAKRLIETHKGQIFVESKTDEGSTFTIVFPISLRDELSV
ncbi:MAG: MASE3 domain-containing protein [Nitrososphaeria archaeon]